MVEEIREYCNSLPLVCEDFKWGENLCFSVAGKLFILISLDELPIAASFKVNDEDFESISAKDGFVQAPYFAKNKWVKILDINSLSIIEWKNFIDNSYHLISRKLTKKLQLEIATKLNIEIQNS